jgi:Protein of unknown function (DUF2845)
MNARLFFPLWGRPPTRQRATAGGLAMVLAFALAGLAPGAAQAESLRCNGSSVGEGDSRLSVRYKCGEPVLSDQSCAPVWHWPSGRWVPTGLAGVLPCQVVEEWLYNRGPGQLMATVRFREGRVLNIVYGQVPR